jgi:hypothetical protein
MGYRTDMNQEKSLQTAVFRHEDVPDVKRVEKPHVMIFC